MIVADLGRILAGFTGGGATRDDDLDASVGELYSLYVDPELWGRGHGSALHDAALGELVSRGYASAVLWVLEDNAHARGFYLARGWKPEGAQRRFLGGEHAAPRPRAARGPPERRLNPQTWTQPSNSAASRSISRLSCQVPSPARS